MINSIANSVEQSTTHIRKAIEAIWGIGQRDEDQLIAIGCWAASQAGFENMDWATMFSKAQIDRLREQEHLPSADEPFSVDWNAFEAEELGEQEVFISTNPIAVNLAKGITIDEGAEAVVRKGMIVELYAFRGLGKSIFTANLIRLLTKGGQFLKFKSAGGKRVLLVDGELPSHLLQARLKKHVGQLPAGSLQLRAVATLKSHRLPSLARTDVQQRFLADLAKCERPDVIVFDTRTACFKYDTNDQPSIQSVNDFLIGLRSQGYTVILVHHAGKNGTARGRTDNDDDTDLVIKLDAVEGWHHGRGLAVAVSYEKVRYGDQLEPFEARLDKPTGKWLMYAPGELLREQVVDLLKAGMGVKAIAARLKVRDSRVSAAAESARAMGVDIPKNKGGRPKKTVAETL